MQPALEMLAAAEAKGVQLLLPCDVLVSSRSGTYGGCLQAAWALMKANPQTAVLLLLLLLLLRVFVCFCQWVVLASVHGCCPACIVVAGNQPSI